MKNRIFTQLFAIVSVVLLLCSTTLQTNAQSLTLMGVDDAVAWSEFPDQTATTPDAIGGGNILANRYDVTVDETTVTHNVVSFIKFDISAFANRTIKAAEFSTRGTSAADADITIRLRQAGTSFSRDTTNWTNKPSASGELALKSYTNSSARAPYIEVGSELVNYINAELALGSAEIAFQIQYKSGDFDVMNWIGGVGDGAYGPELMLEFDQDLVFYGTDDAVVFQQAPDESADFFHASNLKVTRTDADNQTISFVKFHLPGFAYKKVSEVEFSTRGASNTDTEQVVKLRDAGVGFSRDTTTWNNRPSMGSTLATRVYNNEIGSARTAYTEVDNGIVNYINAELAKGNETIAFGLQYDSGDYLAGNWTGGVGDGAYGPILKVVMDNSEAGMWSIADAVAFSNEPDNTANDWHGSNLLIAEETDVRTVKSFVKFDVNAFSGRVVTDVILSTRSDMNDGTTMTAKLTQSGNAFQRDTTTWNNMPNTSGELATVILDDDSGRKNFIQTGTALVDYVNGKLANGASELSFGLEYKEGAGADLKWMGGLGDSSFGPYLEFVFADQYNSYAADDAVVFEHEPTETAVFFAPTNIQIEDTDTTQIVSFIKFNISDVAGMEIDEVNISTRSDMIDASTMTVKLMEAGTAFSRDTTNWNNKPSRTGELATVILNDDSGRKYFIPAGTGLVDYINMHTLAGEPEVAFALAYKEGAGGDLKWMGGVGDATWGPQMELSIKGALLADTIPVMNDAYVDEVNLDTNYGTAADMGIRKSGDGTDLETFVKFDLTNVQDAVVGKVSLTAYIGQHNSGTQQDNFYVDVYAVEDNSWEEAAITWTNKPAAGTMLIEEDVTWFNSGQDVVWSSDALTHYINDAIMAGKTNVSFVFKGKDNTPGNRLWMAGREWKPLATSLIFDYITPPPVQEMNVVADSYVSQVAGETANNYGTEADQHLINDDANDASKWNYFKYDISNAYQEVISANIVVYGSIHDSSPGLTELPFAFYPSSDVSWEEEVITWDNKPSVDNTELLTGTLLQGGRWFTLTSAAFTDYINTAIENGDDYITLVAKATVETPGERGWFSGKEWRASYLTFNYEPEVALPNFSPNPGNYISSVDVSVSTPTAGATIYYTTDGTDPSDTEGTLYEGPITLTAESDIETVSVKAIAYAPELKPSGIVSATYIVTPVGLPEFTPTPAVAYQQSVLVSISVEPAGSIIRYSDDGSAPTTLYSEPILLTAATTLRAQAYNADFSFSTDIVEATYNVVETEPAPGVGPAGIGFADLSRENQPAIGLWLRAHDLAVADGEKVNEWADMSGNENNAHNDETLVDQPITNTGENWRPAPTFTADGLNGWPTVNFGTQYGGENQDVKNLVVNDADNLDGGAGISIFVVMKRNQFYGDFASIIQKRDIRNSPAQVSYVVEMNGGGDPHLMQFVIARDIFLKSADQINADDFYLINSALNSQFGLSTFMTNGNLDNSAAYAKPIQNSHSPVIVGGFQPVDIAEIVLFNSDVNNAQTVLVHNYLAAKYGLSLADGVLYTDADHVYDIIGVGRVLDIAGVASDEHKFSAGGGLQIFTTGLAADGDFVIAGHNGAAIDDDNEGQAWNRFWNVETAGNGGNVSLRFDFDAEGVTNDPSADYKLWYKDNADAAWTDMGITPSVNERVLAFDVVDIQNGIYAIGITAPGGTSVPQDISAVNDGFNLYPNPAKGQINVDVENAFTGTIEIRLLDMYGRLITSDIVTKDGQKLVHQFDLEGLRSGTYMVEVKDSNRRSIKLFLVK